MDMGTFRKMGSDKFRGISEKKDINSQACSQGRLVREEGNGTGVRRGGPGWEEGRQECISDLKDVPTVVGIFVSWVNQKGHLLSLKNWSVSYPMHSRCAANTDVPTNER